MGRKSLKRRAIERDQSDHKYTIDMVWFWHMNRHTKKQRKVKKKMTNVGKFSL